MSLVTPILIVVALWWLGTGIVLYLQQRVVRVGLPFLVCLCAMALLSLFGMKVSASTPNMWQIYLGFTAAIALWGCIELSYYTGIISGVHTRHCPENCDNGKRFRLALGTSIWHELSVLFAGAVVVTLFHKADNPVGLYCFLVLWFMRWSAKLNLFFGVPNFNTDWFPKRLAYAHSYIRRAPISLFFPISMLAASLVAFKLISSALIAQGDQTLITLLPGILLSLAILEHIFMALPIADSELWNRIFVREDHAGNKQSERESRIELLAAHRVRKRTQNKIHEATLVPAVSSVSVAIKPIEAHPTRSISQ